MHPYVVSADIYLLLTGWAECNDFVLPSYKFFEQLRSDFTNKMLSMFPAFELVSEEEIQDGMSRIINAPGLCTLSLDRVYTTSDFHIDISRSVGINGNETELKCRPGASRISTQFEQFRTYGIKEVMLIDDVIFSGELLEKVIDLLKQNGTKVPVVCAGVGIKEGVKKIQRLDAEVYCVRSYEEVVDEVCERDFYPGIPFSGRLFESGNNVGIPYILPFGKPNAWASIPTTEMASFSKFCLRQTVSLFDEIEKQSEKEVCCCNLGRNVIGLPTDTTHFTTVLTDILNKIH